MQEELEKFFIEHDKSIEEKMKLIVDFSVPSDNIELESSLVSVTNKLEISPVFKSNQSDRIKSSSKIKTEIVNLKNKKNNKNLLF